MNRPIRSAGGYALVEVLVAVVVFAILSASAYVALDSLSRAAGSHQERSRGFGSLQLAVARLDSDLRQLVSRPVTAPGGHEPALVGEPRRLAATRAGWANPAGVKRSTLQRFGWRLSGSDLERIRWPVTDRVADGQQRTETVLADVRSLAFSYRDAAGTWHDRWPLDDDDARASLPTAIEVIVDSRRFGLVRRVVVLE